MKKIVLKVFAFIGGVFLLGNMVAVTPVAPAKTVAKPATSKPVTVQKSVYLPCVQNFNKCLVACTTKPIAEQTNCRNACKTARESCIVAIHAKTPKAKMSMIKNAPKAKTSPTKIKPGQVMIHNQLDMPITVRLHCKKPKEGLDERWTIQSLHALTIAITDAQFANCDQVDVLNDDGEWQTLPQGFITNRDNGTNSHVLTITRQAQ